MARLTYQDADGSWGLHGVSWDQLEEGGDE